MSASDLQLLYKREKKELENLKERLDEALSKKETAKGLLNELKSRLEDLESNIENIENYLDELFEKKAFNPANLLVIILSIILAITLMLGMGLVMVGSPMFIVNVLKIPIYNNFEGLLLLFGSWFGGFFGLIQLTTKGMLKVTEYTFNKIDDYLTNKVVKSTEYKELEFLHKASLELLEREQLEFEAYVEEKDKANESYATIKKEYDTKKGIVEYLDRQINPVETTLSLNKELKPNHNSSNKTEG